MEITVNEYNNYVSINDEPIVYAGNSRNKTTVKHLEQQVYVYIGSSKRYALINVNSRAYLALKYYEQLITYLDNINHSIMYEIHVTVNTQSVDKFVEDCNNLGYKPIVIGLQGEQQVMTSTTYKGMNFEQNIEAQKEQLLDLGYELLRIKVEVHPDFIHHAAFPDPKYLECHLRIHYNPDNHEYLLSLAKQNGWHPSKNVFKAQGGELHQLLTYRTKDLQLDRFKQAISDFWLLLIGSGFQINKKEIEACVLDTNEELDAKWLACE